MREKVFFPFSAPEGKELLEIGLIEMEKDEVISPLFTLPEAKLASIGFPCQEQEEFGRTT